MSFACFKFLTASRTTPPLLGLPLGLFMAGYPLLASLSRSGSYSSPVPLGHCSYLPDSGCCLLSEHLHDSPSMQALEL